MPKAQSLDELVAGKAAEFADQLRAAAAMADKEEEIRIEAERQLAFIEREAGVKLEGKHEFTVARGRVDSVYSRVYLAGALNSAPAQAVVLGYVVLHPSPHVLENVAIPSFDPNLAHHKSLSTLAAKCRKLAEQGQLQEAERLQADIDKVAAKLWDITDEELRAIQEEIQGGSSEGSAEGIQEE